MKQVLLFSLNTFRKESLSKMSKSELNQLCCNDGELTIRASFESFERWLNDGNADKLSAWYVVFTEEDAAVVPDSFLRITDQQKEIFNGLVKLYQKAQECDLYVFFDRITNKLCGMNKTHIDSWFGKHDTQHYVNPVEITPFLHSAPCAESYGGFLEVDDEGGIYATLK